jgi:hypothetical protein
MPLPAFAPLFSLIYSFLSALLNVAERGGRYAL